MINTQNIDDNECFKWSIVRYLILQIITQQELQKLIQILLKKLDCKDVKFPVKIRDINKIEKKNYIGINVFSYEYKEKHPIYVSNKCCEEKDADLLLIGEEGKRKYVLIKDFISFMYDHTSHGKKNFSLLFTSFLYKRIIKTSN